jgi:hypothetical protein
MDTDIEEEIAETLMPFAWAQFDRVREKSIRFVHYTRAEAALDILQSNCIWMRNATCMNDYGEMKHGLKCLIQVFQTDAGASFNEALENCHSGLAAEVDAKFTAAAPSLLEHVFITSVSEHADDEEAYGRLSMWQSYGSDVGVALVFNNGPFLRESAALPIYLTPVAYINEEGLGNLIGHIAQRLREKQSLFASMPRGELADWVVRALILTVVSSKHEGFKEEKEWRVVHLPQLWPAIEDRLPMEQKSLGGIPQTIFKIPFVDYEAEGFYGVTLPDLIDRIIVGPTQYPTAIRTAFIQALSAAGTKEAHERVHCSDLTLRV